MTTHTHTYDNDKRIFEDAIDALIGSALGEKNYNLGIKKNIATYDDVARFLSSNGTTNKFGNTLTGNTLKQVIHRCKKNEKLIEEYMPSWDMFDYNSTELGRCLNCNVRIVVAGDDYCSTGCKNEYAGKRYKELSKNIT